MGFLHTIAAMWRIIVGQNRRGQIANQWARFIVLAVLFGVMAPLVIWPFLLLGVAFVGLTGLTAAIAFVPLVAFPVFVIILAVAYPLLSGILVMIPGVRAFFLWLLVAIFVELVIGLYFVAVPVWNSPGLIPVLALLVVVLGLWLFLKRQLGWRRGGLFTTALILAIAGVTASFFFGVKKAVVTVQALPRIQDFTINAGEEQVTVVVGPGTFHRTRATDQQGNLVEWVALPKLLDGSYGEQRMKPVHSWRGGEPEGLLRVKGVVDGTTIRFERVR